MDAEENIKKIEEIYADFKLKIGDIFSKKKALIKNCTGPLSLHTNPVS